MSKLSFREILLIILLLITIVLFLYLQFFRRVEIDNRYDYKQDSILIQKELKIQNRMDSLFNKLQRKDSILELRDRQLNEKIRNIHFSTSELPDL